MFGFFERKRNPAVRPKVSGGLQKSLKFTIGHSEHPSNEPALRQELKG